jgi:hypothetical protein
VVTETTPTASSATPRYTIADLCRDAEAHGFSATPRLITDWVELGLLDAPDRHGLGRARGSAAGTWSEAQRQLFLALLDKRREVKHIAPLCNMPVWLWLFWGDEYAPLRQVRRALETWGGVRGGTKGLSWAKAHASARQQVERWGSSLARPKDRQALVDALSKMIYKQQFDSDALVPLLERVFDPAHTGQPRGPLGAPVTPADYALLIRVRLEALAQLDALDNSLFEWARFMYLTMLPQYFQGQPQFAADPELGKLFTRPDINELVNNVCASLIGTIALARAVPSSASNNTLDNPKTWVDNRLRATITHTVATDSGLEVGLEVKPKDHQD